MGVQSQHEHCNASDSELSVHLNVYFSDCKHVVLASLMMHFPEYMQKQGVEGTK